MSCPESVTRYNHADWVNCADLWGTKFIVFPISCGRFIKQRWAGHYIKDPSMELDILSQKLAGSNLWTVSEQIFPQLRSVAKYALCYSDGTLHGDPDPWPQIVPLEKNGAKTNKKNRTSSQQSSVKVDPLSWLLPPASCVKLTFTDWVFLVMYDLSLWLIAPVMTAEAVLGKECDSIHIRK